MLKKKRYTKKVNPNIIKENYPYSIPEICELLGKHKNTILSWINKEGLEVIDNQKPRLIYGKTLKKFIKERQSKIENKCKDNEIFCIKCKTPKEPWERTVDVFIKNEKGGNLQAICPDCEGIINRTFGLKNIINIKKYFVIQQVHNSHLIECFNNSGNCD